MRYFYENVPKLGSVAVSRHAQANMERDKITEAVFERVLMHPLKDDVPAGHDIVWRQRDDIRIVVLLNPTPDTGARLVKTVYRVQPLTKIRG